MTTVEELEAELPELEYIEISQVDWWTALLTLGGNE